MKLGFCSVNGKKKKKNKQTPCHMCDPPLPCFCQKSQPYQTSQQTFILSCFVLHFGMTLELINNNANLIVPYSNRVLFELIQLKKKICKMRTVEKNSVLYSHFNSFGVISKHRFDTFGARGANKLLFIYEL